MMNQLPTDTASPKTEQDAPRDVSAKTTDVMAEKKRIASLSSSAGNRRKSSNPPTGVVVTTSSSASSSPPPSKAGLRGRDPPSHHREKVSVPGVERVSLEFEDLATTSRGDEEHHVEGVDVEDPPGLCEEEEEEESKAEEDPQQQQEHLVQAEVVQERSLLQAEVVNKDAIIVSPEDQERSKRQRRVFLALFALAVVCTSVAIALGVSLATRTDDNNSEGTSDHGASSTSNNPSPTTPNSESSPPDVIITTLPPTQQQFPCFASRDELVTAVDALYGLAGFEVGSEQDPRTTYGDPMGSWCVSKVQNFTALFSVHRNAEAAKIKSDLLEWDLSSATDLTAMFHGAASFNGDVTNWDTSRVTSMRNLFHGAAAFNQDLDQWNVGAVGDFFAMFYQASSFNGDVTN